MLVQLMMQNKIFFSKFEFKNLNTKNALALINLPV